MSIKLKKKNNKNKTDMVEMNRIRIVEQDGVFRFERKIRKEWILVLAENGKPLTALTRELAERMLNEYDF